MSTTTTEAPDDLRTSMRRIRGLTRANAVLTVRNRLTLFYGMLMPLIPMGVLAAVDRGDVGVGATVAVVVLLIAWLFSVYYNVLSLVVSRRDDLVLKRLRTGEVRDAELVTSLALPGVASAVLVAAVVVGVAAAFGQPVPMNLPLYAVTVVVGCLLFVAFALWTAAWTRNAEAAQMTSLPVMAITMAGLSASSYPEDVRRFVDLTPGAALDSLVRASWFGLGRDGDVDMAGSWAAAGEPLLVLLAWGVLATVLARRAMRWEPQR